VASVVEGVMPRITTCWNERSAWPEELLLTLMPGVEAAMSVTETMPLASRVSEVIAVTVTGTLRMSSPVLRAVTMMSPPAPSGASARAGVAQVMPATSAMVESVEARRIVEELPVMFSLNADRRTRGARRFKLSPCCFERLFFRHREGAYASRYN